MDCSSSNNMRLLRQTGSQAIPEATQVSCQRQACLAITSGIPAPKVRKSHFYIDKRSPQRGRLKRPKARDLLERLDKYRTETLNFMFDFRISLTGYMHDQSQAENFRWIPVPRGAKIFCRIRGYISTVKNNSVPVLGAIRDVFLGNPFVPNCADVLKSGVWPANLGKGLLIINSQALA